MSRAYTRAYVDRDATKDSGPLRIVAATEGKKGDGIDLRMSGARLDRYISNPVIGYGHNYWGRNSLPIGKASNVHVDGPRLLMDVEFDMDDEFAVTVDRKYRNGYLNAFSIGFDVFGWEEPNASWWTGGTAVDWELVENSAVPLPMDADALVESGRAQRLHAALAEMREGKVLSAASQELVEDAMSSLAELLASSTAEAVPAAAKQAAQPAGRSLDLARRRLQLAGF